MPRHVIKKYHEYVSLGHNRDAPGRFIEWYHKKEKVYAFIFTGHWFDIGRPDTYLDAFKFLLNESHISDKADVKNAEIVDPVIIEDHVEVLGGKIGPYVYIGGEAKVYNSTINNSIILDKTIISKSSVQNSLISHNVELHGVHIMNSNIGGYTKLKSKSNV